MNNTFQTIVYWLLRLVAAAIMLQTLFFKFTASPESVFIFSTLGMEPWGRIGTGIMELIASVLILIPRSTIFGALLSIALMSGAIFFHFTKLGIEVQGDRGLLFTYALVVLMCSVVLAITHRRQVFRLFSKNGKSVEAR